MKSKLQIFSLIIFATLWMSYSSNPPNGKTGAPFEGNCTDCHSPGNTDIDGTVEIFGMPSSVGFNKTYPLTVKTTITSGDPKATGFQLTIVDSDNNQVGTLHSLGNTQINNANGRQYLEHAVEQKFYLQPAVYWNFSWTAPASISNTENLKIYLSSVLTNGNSKNSGDKVVNANFDFNIKEDTCDLIVNDSYFTLGCNKLSICGHENVSGGTPPYSYQWSINEDTATTDCIDVWREGIYVLKVTDVTGCSVSNFVGIDDNSDLIQFEVSGNLVLGDDGCTTLNANILSNNPVAQYQWKDSNNEIIGTNSTITICTAGDYTLAVTNAENGCYSTENFTIESCNITIQATSSILNCNTSSVSLCPTVLGGTAPFIFEWMDPQGTIVGTGACFDATMSGSYNLVVTDINNCTSMIDIVVLEDLNIPVINVTGNLQLDENGCTTLDASTSTGNNLIFEWYFNGSSIGNSNTITVCQAGVYTLNVTDPNNECVVSKNFTVVDPCNITIQATSSILNCNTSSVSLCPTVLGGTAPFIFEWMDPQGTIVGTGACFDATMSGSYNLVVTDINNCTSMIDIVVLEDLNIPVITFFQNDYTIKPGDCTNLGFTTTATHYSVSWTGPNSFVSTVENPNVCEAGSYSLTITNLDNGCSAMASVTVLIETATINMLDQSINISPNPTSDLIHIEFEKKLKGNISIISLQGQILKNQKIEGLTLNFNLKDFSKGVYFLKIESDMGIFYEKILKQ